MPTGRAWACIAGAGATLGAGAALRIPELVEIGVALLVLVVVQLARTTALGRDLTATRSIHPPSALAGSPVTVTVEVSVGMAASSRRRLPSMPAGEALVWVDPAPQPLGGARRIELVRQGPRRATGRYQLTPARRGHYVIGPGRVAWTDPFGLVQVPRPTGDASGLIVFPRLEPLVGRIPRAASSASARSAAAAALATGPELFTTREWRPGDDMRRIHWRSTARMGTVMVRQEDRPRRDRATVVLDDRPSAYDGDDDAFERAVEAAASLVHHFLREGFAVRLTTATSSLDGVHSKGAAHHRLLMTALATIGLAPRGASAAPPPPPAGAGRTGGAELVVLVGGMPEVADRDALVVLTTRTAQEPSDPRVLHVTPGHTLAAAWSGL